MQHTSTPSIPLPPTLSPTTSILPRRYVLHLHSTICKHCGRVSEWSQVYSSSDMLSRTGSGKAVTHLVPERDLLYNLPISVTTIAPSIIPTCHECVEDISLSHLIDPRNLEEWRRQYAPSYSTTPSASPERKPRVLPTIDDLLA